MEQMKQVGGRSLNCCLCFTQFIQEMYRLSVMLVAELSVDSDKFDMLATFFINIYILSRCN